MKKLLLMAVGVTGCLATTEEVVTLKRELGILKTRVTRAEKEAESLSGKMAQHAMAIRAQGRKLDVLASRPPPQPKIVYVPVPEKSPPVVPDSPKGDEEKKVVLKLRYDKFTEHVQRALKAAGYEPGAIDGKNGRKTTLALKEFQKAHGLVATGMADRKTWAELKKFLPRPPA